MVSRACRLCPHPLGGALALRSSIREPWHQPQRFFCMALSLARWRGPLIPNCSLQSARPCCCRRASAHRSAARNRRSASRRGSHQRLHCRIPQGWNTRRSFRLLTGCRNLKAADRASPISGLEGCNQIKLKALLRFETGPSLAGRFLARVVLRDLPHGEGSCRIPADQRFLQFADVFDFGTPACLLRSVLKLGDRGPNGYPVEILYAPRTDKTHRCVLHPRPFFAC